MTRFRNFAAWLKVAHKRFDTRTLGELTGVDPSTISRLESGDVQEVSLFTAVRICSGLRYSLEEFAFDLLGGGVRFPERLERGPQVGGCLSGRDVEDAVAFFRRGEQAACAWLGAWLDAAVAAWGSGKRAPEEPWRIFSSQAVELLLSEKPFCRLAFAYPPDIGREQIITLYRQGGAVTFMDACAYVERSPRAKIALPALLAAKIRVAEPFPSPRTMGSLERIPLGHVLWLAQASEQGGELMALLWSASQFVVSNWRQGKYARAGGEGWTERECLLASVFISACRWLQQQNQGGDPWLPALRSQLRAAQPRQAIIPG